MEFIHRCKVKVEPGYCKWNLTTLNTILNRQEYLGHLVLRKTTCVNFKSNLRRETTEAEQYFFPNVHEPIISQELWDKVHRTVTFSIRVSLYDSHQNQKISGSDQTFLSKNDNGRSTILTDAHMSKCGITKEPKDEEGMMCIPE